MANEGSVCRCNHIFFEFEMENVFRDLQVCRGKEEGHRIPNIDDNCRSFVICNDGMPQETKCPNGLLFNPLTKNCDWAANVKCVCRSNDCMRSNSDEGDSSDEVVDSSESSPDICAEGTPGNLTAVITFSLVDTLTLIRDFL